VAVRDVVYATDFSTSSEAAGRVARDMARQSGARLHVVYVVPPVTDPGDSAAELEQVAGRLGEGIVVERAVLSGRPARRIVAYARDKGAGIIVVGSHGRTGVTRAILGSVAEAVVRTAPCPVLTVPSGGGGLAGGPGAEAAAEALDLGRCLACARECEDLVCEPCRTRFRGEALRRRIEAERAGRRGSPV
jgi:nucleotide-binding universal stress UspA family protein